MGHFYMNKYSFNLHYNNVLNKYYKIQNQSCFFTEQPLLGSLCLFDPPCVVLFA